jgi:hypothetical protein
MRRAIEEVHMTERAERCGALIAIIGVCAGGCAPAAWAAPDARAWMDAADATAWEGRGGGLDDGGEPAEDAGMSSTVARREPFTFEPADTRIEVHAGDRALLPIRLERALDHDSWIELHAQGLPSGVAALYAIGRDPSEVALVIEAADTAAPVRDLPFTVEASADGVRRARRLTLTVLPERAIPEE